MKKPTLEEVQHYCLSRRNGIDPAAFIDFYDVNGWVQGKACKPIKDWKACVRTWERRRSQDRPQNSVMANITDRSWAQ